MSESKYRALLASIAASEGRGVDWAGEIEAVLAEPPAQAKPDEGEAFCDGHCTWLDHHPDCRMAVKDGAK